MKKEPELIKSAILKFLRVEGLETPYNEHRLIASWESVVGEKIAKRSSNLYIKQNVLYVHITSAPLKDLLYYNRKILVNRLNNEVGSKVINDIVFR